MIPFLSRSLLARSVAAALLGAAGALGLAPLGLWPVTVLAQACLTALLAAGPRRGQAFLTGWLFGTGYFALALVWIVEPFMVDVARHGWMAPFALVFMSGGLALFWGAAFWGAARLARRGGARIALLACTWTLAEFARAYLFTGFPWAAPGQIWVGTPVMPLLAWIGPQGLNLATFLAALPLGLLLSAGHHTTRLASLAPALLLAAATLPPPQGEVAMTGQTVRLVQPNAPQQQKWDPAYMPVFFQRQVEYTAAAPRPDLVVWPEAALPNRLNITGDPLQIIADAAAGAEVVLGLLRPGTEGYYNSLVRLDGTGAVAGIYDKHHLVPFGEYIPYANLFSQIGLSAIANAVPGGMTAGPGPQLMPFGALGTAVPLICYEAVFAQDVAGAPGRGSFLLQITNDAWFGTWSGPYQHLAQARMRAVEQGLPMIRVANTGISAMIDPHGRIIAELPLGEAGYADAPLPAALPPTFYAKTGDFPVFLLTLALVFGLWRYSAAQNREISD